MPRKPESWPHAPVHRLAEHGTFMVTAATYGKRHHFRGARRLGVLCRGLLELALKNDWQLEAWAVFSNHYHFVGHSPSGSRGSVNLVAFLQALHSQTALWVNRFDGRSGRKVWHNFWDTRMTFERSYYARLSYVRQNAVMHGLVCEANQYPWCSEAWFERTATGAQVKTIYGFKIDRVRVRDDYEVADEW